MHGAVDQQDELVVRAITETAWTIEDGIDVRGGGHARADNGAGSGDLGHRPCGDGSVSHCGRNGGVVDVVDGQGCAGADESFGHRRAHHPQPDIAIGGHGGER